METAIILKCKCINEFQDKEYGKQMRLHTINQKDKNKKEAYCTVCTDSRRRNKNAKEILASDNKPFGMLINSPNCIRISKSY